MALSESPEKEQDEHRAEEEIRSSRLPKSGGGYLSSNYDTWKPKYVDEYTWLLQDNLVKNAMIDELDYRTLTLMPGKQKTSTA